MQFLSNSETALLEALATYKFLTNAQIERIGIRKGAPNVRNFTKQFLEKHPSIVGRIRMGVQAQAGKIPHLFHLTPKGAKFTAEILGIEPESVKFPALQAVASFHDYAHRVATIDFFIALRTWAKGEGFEVPFTDSYFDKTGASRSASEKLRAKTKIDVGADYIIPDGAGMIDTGERCHLFLLEVYNGMDTKRVMGQLEKHLIAIAEGSPSEKYGFDRGNFVAVVFELEGAKKAVMRRMADDPHFMEFKKHFKFKTIDDFKDSFYIGWELFDGSKVDFI